MTKRLVSVSDDAARFRRRAQQCRELAAKALDEYWRQSLEALAQDLDAEANEIDEEKDR